MTAPFGTEIGHKIWNDRYRLNSETWLQSCKRVASVVNDVLPKETVHEIEAALFERKIVPAGRYWKNAGTSFKHFSNCLALEVDDTTESWGKLAHDTFVALMRGTGVGINFSKVRPYGASIRGSEDYASGPVSLMQAINGIAETVRSGGVRRSALMFILHESHKDARKLIEAKEQDGHLAMANVDIELTDMSFEALFEPHHPRHDYVRNIVQDTIRGMFQNGEPGFLVNTGAYNDERLCNPCGEFRTNRSGEVCNLGSVNFARIKSLRELERCTWLITMYLIAAREVASVPFDGAIFERVGSGIMGLHEWMVQRKLSYAKHDITDKWLATWANATERAARDCQRFGLSKPSRLRSVAPNGTIGLMTETTAGTDPDFCSAQIRRWYKKGVLTDTPVLSQLAAKYGTNECAMNIGLRERLDVLAQVQYYTDMAVSHTINLPEPRNPTQHEIDLILEYLPKLRGLTCYPNGARNNQPCVPITVEQAREMSEQPVLDENEHSCPSGVCGL